MFRRGTAPPPGRPESRGSVRGSLRNGTAGARAPGSPGTRDRAAQEYVVRAVRRRTPHAAPLRGPVFRCGRGCSPLAALRISQYGVESGQRTVTRSRYTRSMEENRGARTGAPRRVEAAGGSRRGEKSPAAGGRCRIAVRRNSVRRRQFRSGAVPDTARAESFTGEMNSFGEGLGKRGAVDHRTENPGHARRTARPGPITAVRCRRRLFGQLLRPRPCSPWTFRFHATCARHASPEGARGPRPHAGAAAFREPARGTPAPRGATAGGRRRCSQLILVQADFTVGRFAIGKARTGRPGTPPARRSAPGARPPETFARQRCHYAHRVMCGRSRDVGENHARSTPDSSPTVQILSE
jgi:hypothetical protein